MTGIEFAELTHQTMFDLLPGLIRNQGESLFDGSRGRDGSFDDLRSVGSKRPGPSRWLCAARRWLAAVPERLSAMAPRVGRPSRMSVSSLMSSALFRSR